MAHSLEAIAACLDLAGETAAIVLDFADQLSHCSGRPMIFFATPLSHWNLSETLWRRSGAEAALASLAFCVRNYRLVTTSPGALRKGFTG